ncbi:hypothetical protein T02_15044, partial [Trichinella nativa]
MSACNPTRKRRKEMIARRRSIWRFGPTSNLRF